MGNCQESTLCNQKLDTKEIITNTALNVIDQIKQNLITIPENENIDDPIYGIINILEKKDKKTDLEFKLAHKQLHFQSKEEYKIALQLYENRFYGLNHPNLLIIHGEQAMQNRKHDEFFNQEFIIELFLDYPARTFQKELIFRQSAWMSEFELLYFLDSIVGALSFLQSKGISHLNITFQNIYIVPLVGNKTGIKLIDPLMKPDFQSAFQLFYEDQSRLEHIAYFSPEQIAILKKQEMQTYNEYKSDVFTLGMLLLELCTLTKCHQAYNISEWKLDEDQIIELIAKADERYSEEMLSLIRQMLCFNPKKRPDLLELDEMVSNLSDLQGKRIIDNWKIEDYQFCVKQNQQEKSQMMQKKTSLPLSHPELASQTSNQKPSNRRGSFNHNSSKVKRSEQSQQSRKESYNSFKQQQLFNHRESLVEPQKRKYVDKQADGTLFYNG